MLNQRDHPMVILAGYLCIRDKMPEKSFESALRALAKKPPGNTMLLLVPIADFLSHVEPSADNFKTFSAACTSLEVNSNSGAFWVVGSFLPYSFLYKWYDDRTSDDAPWSVRALVLDRLYGGAKKGETFAVTARMRDSLEAAAGVPGFPRAVFLTHTERTDAHFAATLFQSLTDPSIDDLEVCPMLLNHLPFVRDHRDELRTLKLSESRKQIVEHEIDKAIQDKK